MLLLVALAALLAGGCVSHPARIAEPRADRQSHSQGEIVLATALGQIGRPYRFGGDSPEGFDCSGLVRFAHAALGMSVPRSTGDQFAAARPVPGGELREGDVLFFRLAAQPGVSHVAIYAGDGRFVHAPQTGRPVELRALNAWFRARLVAIGRLYP
jgi:murein DD-endopeptidase